MTAIRLPWEEMLCTTKPSRAVAAMLVAAAAAALTLLAAARVRRLLRDLDADAAREEELTAGMA
jgi:hypothetical protein